MIKKIIRALLESILNLLWPEYMNGPQERSIKSVFKAFMIQKFLRINSHVPWPVHFTTKVIAPDKIYRGTRTPGHARCCHIDGRNSIRFGKNCWVGPHVCIISQNHDLNNLKKFIKEPGIVIGDNCWIGAGAIILPGVELGNHTIVGAGAVVTRSFPEGDQMIAGNPAKFIKKLESYKSLES